MLNCAPPGWARCAMQGGCSHARRAHEPMNALTLDCKIGTDQYESSRCAYV